MGLSDFFDRIINGPVGNNFDNKDEDVRQVRRGLEETGYLNGEEKEREDSGRELGIITRNLDAGIRRFQRDNGLKEDGYLKPGGETESALAKRLNEKREQGVRDLRERLNSSRRGSEPADRAKPEERPNPLRVNEEEIFRQYMLAQAEPEGKRGRGDPLVFNTYHGLRINQNKLAERMVDYLQDESHERQEDSVFNTKDERLSVKPQKKVNTILDNPKEKREYLDKIEKVYRDYVQIGRRGGFNEAANHLEHFLDGSGKPITYTEKEAKNFRFIQVAEKKNEERFKKSFSDPKSRLGKKISSMKDGEEIELADFWDYQTKSKNPNEYAAFGKTTLSSKGKFIAQRIGEKIEIVGTIDHIWDDVYDFEPEQIAAGGATVLEKEERAKSFRFGSKWKKDFRTSIRVKK